MDNENNTIIVELTSNQKSFLLWKKNKHGYNSMAEVIRDYLRSDPERIHYSSE